MTTNEFEQVLRRVTDKVFHLQAPASEPEYIVWHGYGHNSLIGDDGVRVELLKVQLDIIWQNAESGFLERIKGVLSEFEIPYFEVEYGYDDEWAAMRCILQTELD